MDWKTFWNNRAEIFPEELAQVGRGDGSGYAEEGEKFKKTLRYLLNALQLKPSHKVLDVCCGNGVITHALAQEAQEVLGIDFSENLLKVARRNSPENCRFELLNALEVGKLEAEGFDRCLLHFSLQYVEKASEVKTLFRGLAAKTSPGGLILISDIPDATRMGNYYTSPKDKIRRLLHKLQGRDDMGKFWRPKQLIQICTDLGLNAEVVDQPSELPYSHYRFDLRIRP